MLLITISLNIDKHKWYAHIIILNDVFKIEKLKQADTFTYIRSMYHIKYSNDR